MTPRPSIGLGAAIGTAMLLAGARDAVAGNSIYDALAGATPDGSYLAVYKIEDDWLRKGTCGLVKAKERTTGDRGPELLVRAQCEDRAKGLLGEDEPMPLELGKWKWPRASTEIRALRPFDEEAARRLTRLSQDRNTHLWALELLHRGAWIPVRVLYGDRDRAEGDLPSITGVIETASGYIVRLHYADEEALVAEDDAWVFTAEDVADVAGKLARARREAEEATARMREHRERHTGVFAPAPAGARPARWEQRRRHGIARLLRKWEVAAAFGPLAAADLQQALWLSAWFDSPSRLAEAVGWYSDLHARDRAGAEALLGKLEQDPDTRRLAERLRGGSGGATTTPGK